MIRVVFITIPARKAEPFARRLLEERLVACANLVRRVRSLYWWKGKLETAGETLLILKCPARNVRRLMRRARELHPYEVPEIVVLPVCAAYRRYADWVAREARPAGRGP